MRRSFETQHFEVADEVAPSDTLVELRLEMFEVGEQKAEPLTRVTTKSTDDFPQLQAEVDRTGVIKVKRSSKDTEMPKNPE
eukprot:7491535-Lingulodinium_polyedra.AAC.1